MIRTLRPGDQMVWRDNESVVREIVDVRSTGYGWKYPDLGTVTPTGGENYFASENSSDPFFEYGWRQASADERVSPPLTDAPSPANSPTG